MGRTVREMPVTEFNGITVDTSILCDGRNYYSYSSRYAQYIVIHYTGNIKDTALANAKYFNSGYVGASAHYFVDEGSCYQSVPLNNAAWAVGGTSSYKHDECRNKNSISIEMCTSGGYTVAKQTINNTAYLCAKLCNLLGITAENVYKYVLRHYDVWDKSCPAQWAGANSSGWTEFKEQVKNILRGNEGEMTMTQYEELKQEISTLQAENVALKAEVDNLKNPMIYNYIDNNMPSWTREAVQWCIDKGIIKGTGDGWGLDDNKLWTCVTMYRLANSLK